MTEESRSAPVSTASFWEVRAPSLNESESEDEENDSSSIADVLTEMLSVNEDMLLAAADCSADNDVEGALGYQRILHRNLMEMANYIDSMFGVYCSPPSASNNGDDGVGAAASSCDTQLHTETVESVLSDDVKEETALEAASAELASVTPAPSLVSTVPTPGSGVAKTDSELLLETLEADEQLRVFTRTNKRWMKSQHRVRETESVSAIMNATAEKIAAITVDALHQRVHKVNDDDDDDEEEAHEDGGDGDVSQATVVAPRPKARRPRRGGRQKAVIAAARPALEAMHAQLDPRELLNLLPPDMLHLAAPGHHQSVGGMFLPASGMMLPPMYPPMHFAGHQPLYTDPEAMLAMGMPWSSQQSYLRPESGRRAARPLASGANTKVPFTRMCAECRKLHYSMHKCRLILRHTAPEWAPSKRRAGDDEHDEG